MTSICFRTAALQSGSGREVYGVAVPYNTPTRIIDWEGEYEEIIAPRCFARSIAERGHKIKLLAQHGRGSVWPIGTPTELREADDGLHCAFDVALTRAGDEALEAIRAGLADSFSIGFRPIRSKRAGGRITRVEASLHEISLVATPAYVDAVVQGVRSDALVIPRAVAERRLKLLDL